MSTEETLHLLHEETFCSRFSINSEANALEFLEYLKNISSRLVDVVFVVCY